MAERFDEERVRDAIISGIRRQEDCADPVHGESNRATYLLLDALRANGLVMEPNNYSCFSRKGALVAFNPSMIVEGTPAKDMYRVAKMVATLCDVQPAYTTMISSEEPQPFDVDKFISGNWSLAGRGLLFLPKTQKPLQGYAWTRLD